MVKDYNEMSSVSIKSVYMFSLVLAPKLFKNNIIYINFEESKNKPLSEKEQNFRLPEAGMVMQAFNPSTQEAVAGVSL